MSWRLAAPIERGTTQVRILERAQLGVSPDHEIVHVHGIDARHQLLVDRGCEGTEAAQWPVETPLTWLDDLDDAEPVVQTLVHAVGIDASAIDTHGAYRRLRIDDEVMWARSTLTGRSDFDGNRLEVQRGRESTAEAPHAAGATITWLAAGES